eukprot:2676348-Alexandrium_andersonii.AAC.1
MGHSGTSWRTARTPLGGPARRDHACPDLAREPARTRRRRNANKRSPRRQSRLPPQSLFAPGAWASGSFWIMPESSSEGPASS